MWGSGSLPPEAAPAEANAEPEEPREEPAADEGGGVFDGLVGGEDEES
jgi:hypothetical protein